MKKLYIAILAYCSLFLCGCSYSVKQSKNIDLLSNEFEHPYDSTRTKLWWFHGETETTNKGITADMEAFKSAGVGGVVYYDQVHGSGVNVSPVFSKDWWEKLYFAASEAKRIGLSFEANISNGYVAGGPWITKYLSMQKVVASDTIVTGNCKYSGNLPLPSKSEFWDFSVIAFPFEKNIETSISRKPKYSSNIANFSADNLFLMNGKFIEVPEKVSGKSVYINMDFGSPFSAQSITYKVNPRGLSRTCSMNVPGKPSDKFFGTGYQELPYIGQLEVSDDNLSYRKVCDLKPLYRALFLPCKQYTIVFPKVTGRFFRLNLHDWVDNQNKFPKLLMADILLSSEGKVNDWEVKAAFKSDFIEKEDSFSIDSQDVINPHDVVDLTKLVNEKGILNWGIPKGKWKIMRFAHESIGGSTKHGRVGMKGLECDKMSSAAAITQWNNYFKVIYDSLSIKKLPLSGMIMDSHEAGAQNWTPGFENEFLKRRGYDLHPFLPILMGNVVGSPKESERFLYDFRRTIADLISDNYYGTLDSLCRRKGVTFTAQAIGNALNIVGDNIQAKGRVQKPQGEFWAYQTNGSYDIKEASSAAHLYGKKVASAEAFTDAKFSQSLSDFKNLADYAFASGSNEFVVCASAYQPWLDKIPGNTGGGRHYCLNRNNTYWNYSRSFWDYQARCAGLLRKGLPVVDLCIFLGDNAPVKLLSYRLPEIPEGYNFDVCTTDALVTRMEANNGDIVLPDGMKYRMLVIQKNSDITLMALRKIASLVKRGAAVYGMRPQSSASLADSADDKEYNNIVNSLWGVEKADVGTHSFGKGNVYWGMTLKEALSKEDIKPDIALKSENVPESKVYFFHRKLADIDIYFVNNHSKKAFNDSICLRTSKKYAEYWNPVSGKRYSLPVISKEEGMSLMLHLSPGESGFIIALNKKTDSLPIRKINKEEKSVVINGDWNVKFDTKWGGPGEVVFPKLTDWSKHENPDIRYYSGTASYKKKILIEKKEKEKQILLRFDQINSLAKIYLNGKEVSILWCDPWEVDLTPYIVEGENVLEIDVTNSLMNRMIGDSSLPQTKRYTYAYPEIVTPQDPLIPSGIVGDAYLVFR